MSTSTNGHVPTTDSYEQLRLAVLDRLRAAKLEGDRDPEQVRELIAAVVASYQRDALAGVGGRPLRDPGDVEARLGRSILGYGPLQPFVNADSPPIEVEARGGEVSWKDEFGRWHTSEEPTTEEELTGVIDRMLREVGRELSQAHPIISTQVLGGRVRLTASIPPISDELEATLRFYRLRHEGLADMVRVDTFSAPAAGLAWAAMRHPKISVLVSGRPQSGKTTVGNALMRAVPASHKVCCCEDTRELHAPLLHVSYRQTRPRSGLGDDGAEVTLRRLVAVALRSSPERIVVGEVRGEEAAELVRASNAGSSVLCTLHAHSAQDALEALTNAALLGDHQIRAEAVRATFARTIDLVIHLDSEDVELRGGDEDRPVRRQVMEIAAVSPLQGSDTRFTTVPIFLREEIGAPLRWTRNPLPEELGRRLDQVLRRYGTTTQAVLEGREVIGL